MRECACDKNVVEFEEVYEQILNIIPIGESYEAGFMLD